MTPPRAGVAPRGVVAALAVAAAFAAVAAVRAVVDRAARPPSRCPSELTWGGRAVPPPADPRALARYGR